MRWALRQLAEFARPLIASAANKPITSYDNLAGAAYGALIEAELRDEAERRDSIEGRAQTVVSSVGAIVGIAVAVASLVGLGVTSDPNRAAALMSATPGAIAETLVSETSAPPAPASPTTSPNAGPVTSVTPIKTAVPVLGAAGLAFAASVIFALFALLPRSYQVAHIDALDRLTTEQFWAGPRALGARRAAEVRARELRWARIANARKSKYLQLAVILEVVGIYAVGILGFVLIASRLASP